MEKLKIIGKNKDKEKKSLIDNVILPEWGNAVLTQKQGGVEINMSGRMVFATGSYSSRPYFFTGGNIGKVAVCSVINELAIKGAIPRYLSVGFIVEEGFDVKKLRKILQTIKCMADETGVYIINGDIDIAIQGSVDGIIINITGLGDILPQVDFSVSNIMPEMNIILSGCVGAHAAAIMTEIRGLVVPEPIESDCSPLSNAIQTVLEVAPTIGFLQNTNHLGVAETLENIAKEINTDILIDYNLIPIDKMVHYVCGLFKRDILKLKNEGCFLAFVMGKDTEKVLTVLRANRYGRDACIIGRVEQSAGGHLNIINQPAKIEKYPEKKHLRKNKLAI